MTLLKPHEVQNKRGVSTVVRENPTMYITSTEGQFVVQRGKVMDVVGNEIDPIPDSFWVEYAKTSPEARAQVGLELKVKK